jgi:acetylornithine deacetylase/succinyl-diaminopimelate desuccinylase family protein
MSDSRAVTLLKELVAIPSVNPQGDPGTDQVGEQRIAEHVAAFLQNLGAEVELQPVQPGRPNVVATFHPHGKARGHLAFAPHTDTVSVAGMTISPFDPVIRNGRLYGRGASDTKGPMAAVLAALEKWATGPERKRSQIRWTFTALMGEEAGNEGAIALARSGFKADFILVIEPTSLQIVHAHKGALWLTVQTRGKACHASIPEKGENAIYNMRRAIEVLEKKVIPALKKRKHPRLGHTSLSVGTIRGGSKVNIVPDFCEMEVDLRTIPGFASAEVQALVSRELKRAVPGVRVLTQRSPGALDTDPGNPWLQKLRPYAKGLAVAPWFCDAAVFAGHGIPAVAIGPGSIAQAHTEDEFIRLADLEAGERAFYRFLCSVGA